MILDTYCNIYKQCSLVFWSLSIELISKYIVYYVVKFIAIVDKIE